MSGPLWITEAEVVDLMSLPEAIEALKAGLRLEADGAARNMSKTHVAWGDGDTLHALGATFEGAGVVGAKTWAHTEGGATPLLVLWDAHSGALKAVVEAFALGQMRTGGISGVATDHMAAPDADVLALIGTGRQALAQLAAVAAVRPLRRVAVWGRDAARRDAFVGAIEALGFDFKIETPATVAEATAEAGIITLVTRAREPFLDAAMAQSGAHINAVGAITPGREELASNVIERAELIVADDPATALRLSTEFIKFLASGGREPRVTPLSGLVATNARRRSGADLTVFKAMGMGISDLSLGVEILNRAAAGGRGRPIPSPARARPRLRAQLLETNDA